MIDFRDIIYGQIELPDWLEPFIKLPEVVRLRGVRLSNVDSYQFKDLGGPNRWEHSLGVAFLALRCADKRKLNDKKKVHLILAALLHDVATPPFAHTAEQVLSGFNHELESQNLLLDLSNNKHQPSITVFASQLPKFRKVCKFLTQLLRFTVDPDEIARMIIGDGELGFLINGTIDLDNIDNVVRASMYMGSDVDKKLPVALAEWLAMQDTQPRSLADTTESLVIEWLKIRDELYRNFYKSTNEELGRQAFLQHIMRRAIAADFPRKALIWNTDDRLLSDIENHKEEMLPITRITLSELVQRYRLLEAVYKIAQVEIQAVDDLRTLSRPDIVQWIESILAESGHEFCVMVSARRYQLEKYENSIFPAPAGSLIIFKLGKEFSRDHIPTFFKNQISPNYQGAKLRSAFNLLIQKTVGTWLVERPWITPTKQRKFDITHNLKHMGDWGFRNSSNIENNVHPYPATFVHAIPAALISALELKGELIIDPFGGTGNTAVEALRFGCPTITADTNAIACLVAKAKMTYIDPSTQSLLLSLSKTDLESYKPANAPTIVNIDKWFSSETLEELCHIWGYIKKRENEECSNILKAAFSAILPACTGRRGKEHGWFADNTPLAKGEKKPPYQDAYSEFLRRLRQNVLVTERLCGSIERDGGDPKTQLKRAVVLNLDATTAEPSDYGIMPNSVAGVITSPPYLCMADYILGQRLSYAWLAPTKMEEDFKLELGARRLRSNPTKAIVQYLNGLSEFSKRMGRLLRSGGFLATVLGAPTAEAFRDVNVLKSYDEYLEDAGFELLWSHMREIHWHRNYGYAKLRRERISVHVKK